MSGIGSILRPGRLTASGMAALAVVAGGLAATAGPAAASPPAARTGGQGPNAIAITP